MKKRHLLKQMRPKTNREAKDGFDRGRYLEFFYKIKKELYDWPRMMVVKIKEKKDERHNRAIK